MIRPRLKTFALLLFVAGLLGCSDFQAKQLMRTANEHGGKGEWPDALHYYQRLWVEFPEHELVDQAKLQAARIYAGPEQKPRSATDLYEQLTLTGRMDETQIIALQELSRLYADDFETRDRAIELFEIYLRRHPDHYDSPDVALRLAQMYLDSGRYANAIEIASPMVKSGRPQIAGEANLVIAQAREYANFATEALVIYQSVLEDSSVGDPQWITATAGKARILEAQDRWVEAVETVRLLRDNHPNPEAIERWLVAMQERHLEMKR